MFYLNLIFKFSRQNVKLLILNVDPSNTAIVPDLMLDKVFKASKVPKAFTRIFSTRKGARCGFFLDVKLKHPLKNFSLKITNLDIL